MVYVPESANRFLLSHLVLFELLCFVAPNCRQFSRYFSLHHIKSLLLKNSIESVAIQAVKLRYNGPRNSTDGFKFDFVIVHIMRS